MCWLEKNEDLCNLSLVDTVILDQCANGLQTLAKFNAKKKSLKVKKSKAGDDNNSTNNDIKHFNLSDFIINGLTTEIMIGDSKARRIAKRWFQNANKGTSNQADPLVRD